MTRSNSPEAPAGAQRPTVHDVARVAGVSLATVDRVLNGRAGVREVTARKVAEAVAALGFERDAMAASLSKRQLFRLTFLIADGPNAFMRTLAAAVADTARHSAVDRTVITIDHVPPFDGPALARRLDAIAAESCDGVAVVATESAEARDAIARLIARGVAVITLISDLPSSGRAHFVGIDNVVAGRTAAGLLGRFCRGQRGKLAVVAGSMLLRDHMERRMGFERVMRQEYPGLEVLPSLEGRDDSACVARLLGQLLAETPDVVGLYSLGAGNRGVLEALATSGRAGQIPVVLHELTGAARAGLLAGTVDAVINQDAGHEARSAVRVLKALIQRRPFLDAQERIRIDIFMRDNLP